LATRRRMNVAQGQSFSEMREARARGEQPDLTEDQLAFNYALETNRSSVRGLRLERSEAS